MPSPRPSPALDERLAPWLAALLVALPVLLYRYPPSFDLPCHEEIVAAMRHFGDRARYPAGLMVWNLGHPNQLFYFLACALAYVVPTDLACKIVVAGCAAAVPVAAGRLADHLGVTRWGAVAVAPLGLGFFFYFGFVGNLLGLALLLALLPSLDRFAREPTPRRALGATGSLLLLYAAHESALVIGGAAIAVLSLGQPLLRRASLWRIAPLVALLLVAIEDYARALDQRTENLRALPPVINLALWQKRDQIPQALLGLHGSSTTQLPFLALAAAVALLAVDRLRHRAKTHAVGWRARVDAHRFALLGAALLVAYFFAPFAITGAMWLHARFLDPAVAVIALAIAPRAAKGASLVTRGASLAAVGALLWIVVPELAATGALYRDLDALLPRIAMGSAVAQVDTVGGPFRHLVFSVGGAATRAVSARGGRMASSFVQGSPIPPVVLAPEHRWNDSLTRIARDSLALEPAFDLRRFRYLLAWTPEGDPDRLTRALAPEARFVARSGGWMLFESTLPLEPLLSAEPPPIATTTLRQRLAAIPR